MIFTSVGHTFRVSVELFSKASGSQPFGPRGLPVARGPPVGDRRSKVSHVDGLGDRISDKDCQIRSSGLSNSDFHSKLQPLIHEKLHHQILRLKITDCIRVSYFLFAIAVLLFKGI